MTKKLTQQEALAKCILAHGDTYLYDKFVFVTSKDKVWIGCRTHGYFQQTANEHYGKRKQGCQKCYDDRRYLNTRSNTEEFIVKAVKKFGDKFDYRGVNYQKNSVKVSIRCVAHDHVFDTTPNLHIHPDSKGGCPLCEKESISSRCKKTLSQWTVEVKAVHGDKYDYSKSTYDGVGKKVEIVCKTHGAFWQLPFSHISGQGCPRCAEHGYDRNKEAYLYVLSSDLYTKIGITNSDPRVRAFFINRNSDKNFRVFKYWKFEEGETPLNIETEILRHLNQNYKCAEEKFNGYTESFKDLCPESLSEMIEHKIQSQTLATA